VKRGGRGGCGARRKQNGGMEEGEHGSNHTLIQNTPRKIKKVELKKKGRKYIYGLFYKESPWGGKKKGENHAFAAECKVERPKGAVLKRA